DRAPRLPRATQQGHVLPARAMSGYRATFAAEAPLPEPAFPAWRLLPTAPPAVARVFAVFQIRLRRCCPLVARTAVFSIRLPRAGSLGEAYCASRFRSGSNSRCRSTAPVRAMARSKSAPRRRSLRLAECLSRRFARGWRRPSPEPIFRETAPAHANRRRPARLKLPALNNRALDGSPDQR